MHSPHVSAKGFSYIIGRKRYSQPGSPRLGAYDLSDCAVFTAQRAALADELRVELRRGWWRRSAASFPKLIE
jgi:hypothetical protein